MRIIAGADIETTGLDWTDGHRIIEFAAVLYNFDTGQRVGQYVQRVNPQRPIDPKAQAVHGIAFEELAAEPTWEQVAPNVSGILARTPMVAAHNGEGFDFPFISHELQRVGVASPSFTRVDTMLEARWATPFGKLPNLGELCFACGVDYDPSQAHAALYDVEKMMEAFFKARAMGFYTSVGIQPVPAALEAIAA